ncbi:MAG: transcriptional regulator with XRE-family HTH domain [Maricaulis maris]
MVAEARTLYDRLDEPTFEQKWSVTEAITDHIVTEGRDTAFLLHYVPSQQDDGNYMQNTLGFVPFFPVWGKRFEIPHPDFAALPQSGLPRLLREARLRQGLTKREAARRLGVCVDVIRQWERGEHLPRIQYFPAIIDFLGNDDWLLERSFADRIRKHRARNGWSQARLSQKIGVSERAIGCWERGLEPTAGICGRVERMLAGFSEAHALAGKSGDDTRR